MSHCRRMHLVYMACINLILAIGTLPMPLNYPPGPSVTPMPAAGTYPFFWPPFIPMIPTFFFGITPSGTERSTIPTVYIKITNENQQVEPSIQPSQQKASAAERQVTNTEAGGPPAPTSVLVQIEDSRTNRSGPRDVGHAPAPAAGTLVPTTARAEFVRPEPETITAHPRAPSLPPPVPDNSLAVQPSMSETRSLIIPALPGPNEQQQPLLQTPTETAALMAAQHPVVPHQRSRKKASNSAAEEQAALEQLLQTALLAEMLHQLHEPQNGVASPQSGGMPHSSSANIQPA